jgi:predicted small secreted protein
MRRKLAMFFFSLLLLTGAGGLLSACHTVHGAGQDLESGSDSVQQHL